MSEPVLVSSRDGVAEIRFNRPDRLNALDVELARGFAAAVASVSADPAVRVIVVSSEGRAFVAGGDLAHFRRAPDKTAAAAELIDPIHGALKTLAAAPQIVIGSLKGPVAGGGMSLALGLDLLVAADDATFNLAYARVAASPDCGGSWALPRLVGFRRALEIALLSETIDATEALRLGLVNRVVPRAALEDETARLAARLAAGPAVSQATTKALMRRSLDRTHGEQLDAEARGFGECAATADFTEAVDAFFEKRKPVFARR
jgi:2-(1,2-epoxy-1,2-dihydrophenyl)acetyl-CoA isomerase